MVGLPEVLLSSAYRSCCPGWRRSPRAASLLVCKQLARPLPLALVPYRCLRRTSDSGCGCCCCSSAAASSRRVMQVRNVAVCPGRRTELLETSGSDFVPLP